MKKAALGDLVDLLRQDPQGLPYGSFEVPPQLEDPSVKVPVIDLGASGDLCQWHGHASPFDHDRVAPVSVLRLPKAPFTVARVVTAFVVDAFKRVPAAGLRPHVRVKSFKRVAPTVANSDPPPAVSVVSVAILAFTTVNGGS